MSSLTSPSKVRSAGAIDAWKHAATLDPSDMNALYNLTLNLADAGRMDEARTYGDRFIANASPQMQQDVAMIRRIISAR